MAAAEASALSNTFNGASIGGFAKFAVQTVFFGLLVGGIFDFTLFHNHPMGNAIIEYFNEPLLSFYDGIANMTGFEEYARNTDFLVSAAEPAMDAGMETADNTGATMNSVCMDVDPATGMPACG